jgi:hypothetical protein
MLDLLLENLCTAAANALAPPQRQTYCLQEYIRSTNSKILLNDNLFVASIE